MPNGLHAIHRGAVLEDHGPLPQWAKNFMVWIKQGSYYHGLVAQQGHLNKCPHLAGVLLPRWPQVTPSESHRELQKKGPPTSSSEPSMGATVAPVTETPVMKTPVAQTPVAETPATRSDTPAPMETGRVGDSQSWAEQAEAGIDEEFQKDRPAKHRWSQSRRRKERPTLPFPLQDSEGRLTSISQLYKHVGEQPATCHNVACRGIMHLHPEMLPCEATCLRNQVLCMIAEYHLTSCARGPSSLSPVLPEGATTLLFPIKDYVPGITFEGTRDVRVVDRAKTLRVAVLLHQLDMSTRGDGMSSETLEASQHSQGPLLDLFLTPMTSNLTFKEVVNRVLYENQRDAQRSLDDLRAHCTCIHKELDDLTKTHREESNKSLQKRIKKEIDMRHKDLKSLRVRISHHESHLRQDPSEDNTPGDDGLFSHGAEAEMATSPGADDAPSESTTTQASDPPPTEGQTHAMEVDDEGIRSPLASPVSPADDDLLTGSSAIGVEADLAHLTVSSPRGPNGEGEEASI